MATIVKLHTIPASIPSIFFIKYKMYDVKMQTDKKDRIIQFGLKQILAIYWNELKPRSQDLIIP